MKKKYLVYLALGSNLGNRLSNIDQAIAGIKQFPLTNFICCSKFHETKAVGPTQPNYINSVLAIKTSLTPLHLLYCAQKLETKLGRTCKQRWHARVIDIDIIKYADMELNFEALTLPHPRMNSRPFVIEPLKEILGVNYA